MPLSQDLLDVARRLATLDAGRPRQAALRRAISTAYCAAFHFLIEEATAHVAGTTPAQSNVRAFLSRGFNHSAMARICDHVSNGNWPKVVAERLGQKVTPPPPQKLRAVASVFRPLQVLRHQADYDTLARLTRANVLIEIDRVETMMTDWAAVPVGEPKTIFLYLLSVGVPRRDGD